MKWSLTALLSLTVVAAALSGAARADDKEKEVLKLELKGLQGAWTVLGVELDGKDQPKENMPARLEFKDGKLTGFSPAPLSFTIDPSKKPKHITLVSKGQDKDVIVNSIYDLKRDNLKLAIPLVEKGKGPENVRPQGFDTKGKPVMLIKLKRAEPTPLN